MLFMVTFTINIPPLNVSIYASTMDPMGHGQLSFFGLQNRAKDSRKKWEDRMDHRMNHRRSSGGSTGFHRPKAGFHPTSAPAGNGLYHL